MLQKCHEDPYLKSFKAKVVSVEGSLLSIEPNYFFSASGGQASDRGTISFGGKTAKVVDVIEEGGKTKLKLEGSLPPQGEEINCEIDWERRYSLMKAHTSEHILFQALSREFPEIKPEKVTIEPGSFSLFVRHAGPFSWDKVLKAEKMANGVVREGRKVEARLVDKDEVAEGVRIKAERISGEKVRVVEAQGFDKVACSGLHVKNTSEIGALSVSRIASEKPGTWQISFLTGAEATDFLLSSAATALSCSQVLGTGIDRLEKTAANLKAEEERQRLATKELAELAFAGLGPEESGGLRVYSKTFSAIEPKLLQDWASKLAKKEKTVIVFAVKGAEKAFLLFGKSADVGLDIRKMGAEAFKLMNGKGGGNESFVSGSGDAGKLDEAISFIVNSLKS